MSVLLDLATRLQDEGVGTYDPVMGNGTIFIGGRPAQPNTCLTLQTYPGDPNRIYGETNVPADERWAVQVMARADTQSAAEPLAHAAWLALPFNRQTLASGRHYAWCYASGMPAFVGKDENARALVSFNVTIRRHNTVGL